MNIVPVYLNIDSPSDIAYELAKVFERMVEKHEEDREDDRTEIDSLKADLEVAEDERRVYEDERRVYVAQFDEAKSEILELNNKIMKLKAVNPADLIKQRKALEAALEKIDDLVKGS